MGDDLRMWGLFVAAVWAKVFGERPTFAFLLSRAFTMSPPGYFSMKFPLWTLTTSRAPWALSTKSPPDSSAFLLFHNEWAPLIPLETSTKAWLWMSFGKVRAVSTPWGTGIRTSSKFSCPKPDQVLGSFGPIVLLSDDEYAASEWHDYGVAWSDTLTALPKCRGRAELDEWGPLVNTASGECGERNNLRLHRAGVQPQASSSTSVNQQASSSAAPVQDLLLLLLPAAAAAAAAAVEQKHPLPSSQALSEARRVLRSQMRLSEDSATKEASLPVIQLVSTRAIGGNEMLLVDYGREYSRALKQKRADAKRLVMSTGTRSSRRGARFSRGDNFCVPPSGRAFCTRLHGRRRETLMHVLMRLRSCNRWATRSSCPLLE
jgi:hypothetical protein